MGNREQGNLTILLPGGGEGRAVLPEILDRLVYTMAFSGPGGEQQTRTTAPGAASVTLTLALGDWTVRADAALGGIPFGSGEAGFRIAGGGAHYVTITMTSFFYTSFTAIVDTLASAAGGLTAADPVPLPVSLDLSSGWAPLLAVIQSEGKFIALDLSACVMGPGVTEFDPRPGPADAGEGRIVSLVLPGAAASIAAGADYINAAFRRFTALTELNAAAVETVGENAFTGCTGLTAVSLPAAASIGEWAFSGCTGLTTVNLPAATTIGEYAFANTGLTTVSLPAAATIDNFAFFRCGNLTTVNLPAAASIGEGAFSGCTGLTTITLPASLTTIEGNPFPGCINLTGITVAAANPNYRAEGGKLLSIDGAALVGWPTASGSVTLNGITTVGGGAFFGCTGLTSVDLSAAITIGGTAFYGCTGLTSVDLSAATTIGGTAFYGCTGLTSVDLSAATTVGGSAFYGCTGLTSVDLSAAITIGGTAFYGCTGLTWVDLSAAASIGGSAFGNTGTTESLTVILGNTPPELGTEMFSSVTGGTKTVTVKVPTTATGYAASLPAAYTGAETAGGPHWGEGFRGKGWNSGMYSGTVPPSTVNSSISLTVQELP